MHRRTLLAATPLLLALPPRLPLAATPISRLGTPWWRARHEAKLAERTRKPIDLVFLGDSITQDYERNGPPPWGNYQQVWQHFYADRNPINLGFTGDATSHLLWRITHGEIDAIAPKAVVILIGANNLGRVHWSADETLTGIATILDETRRRLPHTQILLLSILPSIRSPWVDQTTQTINASLATRYAKTPVLNITYLDLTPVFRSRDTTDKTLYTDPLLTPPEPTLHPSAEGQARMAAALEPTLAKLMGDKRKQ